MSGKIERSKFGITLPADVWSNIVLAAQESDDYRLRTLIEQAVHEADVYTAPIVHPDDNRPLGAA